MPTQSRDELTERTDEAMEAACSDKQTILKTLQSLPEDATMEDAMERLSLLLKVKTGCGQADSGQTVSQAEAETRMQKWLK
jgi:hypothetical protein